VTQCRASASVSHKDVWKNGDMTPFILNIGLIRRDYRKCSIPRCFTCLGKKLVRHSSGAPRNFWVRHSSGAPRNFWVRHRGGAPRNFLPGGGLGLGGCLKQVFFSGGFTNSVEDRGQKEWGSGVGSPLVRDSTQFANE
jgi:hypothetical protein